MTLKANTHQRQFNEVLDCRRMPPGSLRFVPPETDPSLPPALGYHTPATLTQSANDILIDRHHYAAVHLDRRTLGTYDALAECWEHHSEIFVSKGAKLSAMLTGCSGPYADPTRRRLCHQRLTPNSTDARALVASIVSRKIANQATALRLAERNTRLHPAVNQTRISLRRLLKSRSKHLDIPSLRGLEGRAAAMYFGVWDRLLTLSTFRRLARTGTDRVNALLDIGYARLAHGVTIQCLAAGLDIGCGALHVSDGTRPTLALDLMEPLRPLVVDQFVIKCLQLATITSWFEPDEAGQTGYRLTKTGWREFNRRWNRHYLGTPSALNGGTPAHRHVRETVASFCVWLEGGNLPQWYGHGI